jgi:hypothetical protein
VRRDVSHEDRIYRYRFFVDLRDPFFLGTLAPAVRASDKPIAMACFRLLTVLPEPPLFKVPRFRLCIARSTFSLAFFPYLAMHTLLIVAVQAGGYA